MSDKTDTHTSSSAHPGGSGGNSMAFIVGGLVVAVAVIGFFLFTGASVDDGSSDVNINVEGAGQAMEDAAGAVEGVAGAVDDATSGN